MALGSLYKFNIEVDAIGALEMPALIEAVFDLTLRDGELDTGAYLRPQSNDDSLKTCFAALSVDVSIFCVENPSALLQYMFGGPGSVALYEQVLRQKSKEIQDNESKKEVLRAQFKKYIGLGRKEDALNWAWHASALLAIAHSANSAHPVIHFGVIGLNKSASKKQATQSNNAGKDRSPSTFAFSLIDVSGKGGRTFASIFNILGLMDRLLRVNLDSNDLKQEVKTILTKAKDTAMISPPAWEVDDVNPEDGYFFDNDATPCEHLDDISDKIVTWLEKTKRLRGKLTPSAVMIGKIWTRLYFSLEKVSGIQRSNCNMTAAVMELFALCVINAFLVEEFDHHLIADSENTGGSDVGIRRDNPQTSVKVVAEKFKDDQVNHERLPLTFLIASCPLILGLLKYGAHYQKMLEKLGSFGVGESSFCSVDAWEKIENAYTINTQKRDSSVNESSERQKQNGSFKSRRRKELILKIIL